MTHLLFKYSIAEPCCVKIEIIENLRVRVRVMVLNATFKNISAILWLSVLLVKETEVPRENHRPAASH